MVTAIFDATKLPQFLVLPKYEIGKGRVKDIDHYVCFWF